MTNEEIPEQNTFVCVNYHVVDGYHDATEFISVRGKSDKHTLITVTDASDDPSVKEPGGGVYYVPANSMTIFRLQHNEVAELKLP